MSSIVFLIVCLGKHSVIFVAQNIEFSMMCIRSVHGNCSHSFVGMMNLKVARRHA
jgi:hypothetical protein